MSMGGEQSMRASSNDVVPSKVRAAASFLCRPTHSRCSGVFSSMNILAHNSRQFPDCPSLASGNACLDYLWFIHGQQVTTASGLHWILQGALLSWGIASALPPGVALRPCRLAAHGAHVAPTF